MARSNRIKYWWRKSCYHRVRNSQHSGDNSSTFTSKTNSFLIIIFIQFLEMCKFVLKLDDLIHSLLFYFGWMFYPSKPWELFCLHFKGRLFMCRIRDCGPAQQKISMVSLNQSVMSLHKVYNISQPVKCIGLKTQCIYILMRMHCTCLTETVFTKNSSFLL